MIYVREDLKLLFAAEQGISDFLDIDGEIIKHVVKHRRTAKFKRGGRSFFIKCHWGVGWKEIVRNLSSLRLPIISARNEWVAIEALQRIGVDTMNVVACGEEGINPASVRSFIITEELTGTESLEKWAPRFLNNETASGKIRLKRTIIRKVAEIGRRLHTNGINHRDFYLCHLLLDLSTATASSPEDVTLYLVDLHRAQIRKHMRQRWAVKDIGGIFFSSMDLPLTSRDRFRFMAAYSGKPFRETLSADMRFWRKVYKRAVRMYYSQFGRYPQCVQARYRRPA